MTAQDVLTLILASIVGIDKLVASVSAAVEAYEDRKAAAAKPEEGK
jgi:hypothetical protein